MFYFISEILYEIFVGYYLQVVLRSKYYRSCIIYRSNTVYQLINLKYGFRLYVSISLKMIVAKQTAKINDKYKKADLVVPWRAPCIECNKGPMRSARGWGFAANR